MTDVAGIVLGLPGLVTACVDCFNYVQLARNFGSDYARCLLELDAIKMRLSRWGATVGITKSHLPNMPSLGEADAQMARNLLTSILDTFAKAEAASARFVKANANKDVAGVNLIPCDPDTDLDLHYQTLHGTIKQIVENRHKGTSLLKKVKWAFYQKSKFDSMVSELRRLVGDLTELFPPAYNEQLLLAREKMLCEDELESVTESENLVLLRDVAGGSDLVLQETANHILEKRGYETHHFHNTGQINIGDHFHVTAGESVSDWFSPIAYWKHHEYMRENVQSGTGDWLFDKAELKLWRKSLQSSVLWLHGIPGSGKSKLVAKVIDHLKSDTSVSVGQLAYFYCLRDVAQDERSRPQEAIRSILRQLCYTGNVLKPAAALAYKEKKKAAQGNQSEAVDRLTWAECITLFMSLLQDTTTFIVVDAIDELKDEERWIFYETLSDIINQTERAIVRVFLASRDDGDIVRALSRYTNIYISATDNQRDVELFVHHEVERAISSHRILRGNHISESLKADIISTLTNGAQGMFRWVSLQLQALCNPRIQTVKALRRCLGSLPHTLEASYDAVHDQIRDFPDETRIIAENAIRWLLCSKQQLRSSELIIAVSMSLDDNTDDDDDDDLNEDDDDKIDLTADQLLDFCCNLVVLDKSLDTFRMAHLSVREYFEKKEKYDNILIHTMATSACLKALTIKNPFQKMETDGFQTYATLYWPSHCSDLGPAGPTGELRDSLLMYILKDSDVDEEFRMWAKRAQNLISMAEPATAALETLSQAAAPPYSPMFLASGFGLTWLLHRLFSESTFDVSQKNDFGDTALCLAARFGHISVVELLLSRGANIHHHGRDGEPPLHHAILQRHSKVAELLISKGAGVRDRCSRFHAPLHEAAKVDLADTALLLLQQGADVDPIELGGWTPLTWAAVHGSNKVAHVLLKWGADISKRSNIGRTAVGLANKEIMTTLLDFIGDVRHPLLQDSVTTAVYDARLDVLDLLLRRGVDVNNVDNHGKTGLDYALEISGMRALEILMAHGAKPMLNWSPESPYVTKWRENSWFPLLLEAISNCTSTSLAAPVILDESAMKASREELVVVDRHSEWRPYVSLSIPGDIVSVTKVIFTTESHDQGWSDNSNEYGGTYLNSRTWFDAEIATRGKLGKMTKRIQTNVHASREWRTHVNVWDIHDDNKTNREWVAQLQADDIIQVYAKARYPGWKNFVRRVEIEIEGVREAGPS